MSDTPEESTQSPTCVEGTFLPYPYQRVTRDGEILAINEAWEDVLGYDAAEVCGNQFFTYVHAGDRDAVRTAFEQVIAGDRSSQIRLRVRDADGQSVPISLAVRIERDDEDGFVKAHCQFTAVESSDGSTTTAIPAGDTNEPFSATEERMQLAVEGAKLGIWDWDMEHGDVVRDELLANMLGYSPQEMGDELDDWERLVHPDGKQRHDDALTEHVENETDFYQCDYRMETKSGDYKWVRTMGTVVEWDDGEPVRSVGIHLDIDDQKRNQLKLARRTEQLEALNRVVRHDIRNDMNTLYSWAQELEEHVDESGAEALEQVLTSAHHVLELTEVAREFVESLGVAEDVDLEPVGLSNHLQNELEKQRDAYPDADFEIVGKLPDVTVRANEMLSSVFRNVFVNAVEHNDADTPTVWVDVTVHEQTVDVRVADNGPGIADSLQSELFNKGTAGLSGGTGIGLYLVETLVDSYGGDVWVTDRAECVPASGKGQPEDTDPTGAVFVVALALFDP